MRNRKMPTCNLIWISLFTLLFLNACSSVTGNVVPKSGPKMESVYDSMQADKSDAPLGTNGAKKLSDIRDEVSKQIPKPSEYNFKKYQQSGRKDFKKLLNPELKMYVYPHFAGQSQVPVPGYFTGFDAYERDYYALKG
jgi:conjugative transfer region lipoprotein (TIGR03751 family)